MRIGVICEGATDFLTISCFLKEEFARNNIDVSFHLIQPALDNTLPGGWSQVLYWLENNPSAQRSAMYLKRDALFLEEDTSKKFDILLLQLDTDIISEGGFEKFISDREIKIERPVSAVDRGSFIRLVLRTIGGHENEDAERQANEITLAIVESCESWIVAAMSNNTSAESLIGQNLVDAFGRIFSQFHGKKAQTSYKIINKKIKTRRYVCETISKINSPLGKAFHYDKVFNQLIDIRKSI